MAGAWAAATSWRCGATSSSPPRRRSSARPARKVGACPTVGATQYLPRIIGERLAREMIFLARTLHRRGSGEDRPHQQGRSEGGPARRRRSTGARRSRAIPAQTIRITKKSLNFESDKLYASWQHGMELLGDVWGIGGGDGGHEGLPRQAASRTSRSSACATRRSWRTYLAGLASDANKAPAK